MAFTTEFVMGAGGAQVEEIPVSMSGGGGSSSNPTVYPLATVDAGAGALIVVRGKMVPGATHESQRPHLQIGTFVHNSPGTALVDENTALALTGSGTVQVSVLTRIGTPATFTGTVYVARL